MVLDQAENLEESIKSMKRVMKMMARKGNITRKIRAGMMHMSHPGQTINARFVSILKAILRS